MAKWGEDAPWGEVAKWGGDPDDTSGASSKSNSIRRRLKALLSYFKMRRL